jgi:hypothetical protein
VLPLAACCPFVVFAQGNPNVPSNPNIVAAVQGLHARVASLQTTLQGLTFTVSNIRITPLLFGNPGGDTFICFLVQAVAVVAAD